MAKRRESKHRRRVRVPAQLLVVGVLALVAVLYYRPLVSYLETRSSVDARRAEVARLQTERKQLEAQLARSTSDAALQRDARRIGYVKPGERLFIVKGIPEWRRARSGHR